MNTLERSAFRRIPSFRREDGGLYSVYAAVYSRAYAARMRWLHERNRHSAPDAQSISPRCSWCGAALAP